jgi:uncharacterized protein (TIGR02453 family)
MTSSAVFSSEFLRFFNDLSANQNREWFQANKARYETQVKQPMQRLLLDLNIGFAKRNVPLTADVKRSISRINRDVRFSNDKSPYKDYISGTLTRDAGEMSPGLVYLQFGKGEIFAGAGFYVLEPEALTKFRHAVADAPDRWQCVTSHLEAAGCPLEREGGLKRIPRGFEVYLESPIVEDIKLKAFVCKLRFSSEDITDTSLSERISDFALSALPLLDFGWQALDLKAP